MASTSSASPPVTSLSDDIQRALQQAVGDANNAAAAAAAHNKTKKSKRHRDEDGAEDATGNVKKKKKWKRHRDSDVNATANADHPGASIGDSVRPPATSSSSSSSSNEPTPGAAGDAGPSADPAAAAPHKKKKKNKGKERAHDDQPRSQSESRAHPQPVPTPEGASLTQAAASTPAQVHSGLPGDLPTSSADFISAVVAAASATAGHGQPSQGGGPAFEQAMQYMTYPPAQFDPYAYPNPAPPGAHPPPPPHGGQAFPGPFPPDVAGVLPDLHVTSSEDLLRSLQEFDISKVVSVLKTLGEAAAAANVNLGIPPLFMPGPGMSMGQQPVRSEAILGRPPKQKKGRNGNAPGASGSGGGSGEAVPPQPDNPDHTHMLANVWMNASKLAEMVRTEGESCALNAVHAVWG